MNKEYSGEKKNEYSMEEDSKKKIAQQDIARLASSNSEYGILKKRG